MVQKKTHWLVACPLPSTVSHKNWSFRGWFVGITIPVGTGFVEYPVSRPTGSYKFAYLVLTRGRDARNMVPPFIIYHFGWVTSLCWMLQPPKKKHAFTSFFLVKYGEIKSWWMVQPNKTPVFDIMFLLLKSTVHPDRPRSRSSQEPLRLWPSKSCEILGVSGEKPGLTWTNPT